MTWIAVHVREIGALTPKERKARLQELIGPHSLDRTVLHNRALLVTALNEANVWPPRSA